MFGHKVKSPKKPDKPLEPYYDKDDTEAFTFLSPFSNLDLYPGMDHPPYFDMKRCPTMSDVIKVRHFLSSRLPTEIIDILLDLAEYWPHTSSILDMTTRVYHEHMRYGSYGRGPKTWWHNRSSTPEMRREWKETGFILRTPPLGLRCIKSNDRRKAYRQSWPVTPTKRNNDGANGTFDWLPPRGKHPARKVLFEILSREERAADHPTVPGFRQDSKTLFEASVDNINIPPKMVKSSTQPLYWTPEAATTKSYLQNPLSKDAPYTFQPRQSSSANPELRQAFPVFWNRTAQNRKFVVAYRHDETKHFSVEKERYLSASIVRGFVRSLKEGDSIALWGRAREGAGPCCNVVDRVKIHVFWAV